ncbi:tyrosine-type recombinase/integrase [Nitrosomonas aestuarii]|uniref:tyrosine-type recombinase/integrase n=1 Tax=Nitrosomonas aestuarii TaxID=52441 RepID=UPI000D31D911|nr:tyrosine-type recombinase/integrase [Nitrosomonas aestuarii]PTN10772.1 integrase [Nitrosomonas aestuarii]
MDRGHRGITIRGNSAQIAFTYQGVRCRESIPMPPTKAAQKELVLKRQAILYEIKTGSFDYCKHFPHSKKAKEFRKTRPDQYTIGEALKNWLQRNQSRCQPSTLHDYSSAIYHHLIPVFGELVISELTAIKVKAFLADLSCSNKRKSNVLIPLRRVFDELYHDEIIDKNPLERVKNLPANTREPLPFNTDEISRILQELTGQERNLIQFAFYSGLRTSELIALRWQDVDFEKNCIYVRFAKVRGHLKCTKTKSGKRDVTLQPQAREALLNQQALTDKHNEIVFHDSRTNQPWKGDQAIRKIVWTPALKRAGIKYRNPYQTRHTFASMLLSRGENLMWVAQQMGHKDWSMIIKVYGRWIPQSK